MSSKTSEGLLLSVLNKATKILPPANYHQGLLLPRSFELPDNILCFFHDFPSLEYQHNRYCIVLPFDPLVYVLNGIPQKILPGMAVTQRPYAAHRIRSIQEHCRRLQISFDLHEKPDYFPDSDFSSINSASWKIILRILEAFHKHDIIECALEIYHLCRKFKGEAPKEPGNSSPELKAKVDNITEFHRERRENVKSIALQLEMSESNLRLRFRKENGMALGKFLKSKKLEGAQYRLQYTRQTITEISRICGYDSVFSFSRFFKTRTGLSPLQWRKKYQHHENPAK